MSPDGLCKKSATWLTPVACDHGIMGEGTLRVIQFQIPFEKSWQFSDVPSDWKRENITPTFKKINKEARLSGVRAGPVQTP